MRSRVELERNEAISLVKELREMVVSLDRISGASADMETEDEWKEVLIDYMVKSKFLQRLGKCRTILETKFSDEPLGEDDMSNFDREVADIEYWSFAEYKKKRVI